MRSEPRDTRTRLSAVIPTLPEWAPLTLAHRAGIERAGRGSPPYSDLNFASLFAWDVHGAARIARVDDTLVLRLDDYTTGRPLLTLLGGEAPARAARAALDFADAAGLDARLHLVPEPLADRLRAATDLAVRPDRDHFDYVLSIERMATLLGSDLHTQRNQIARFERRHGLDAAFRQVAADEAFARAHLQPLLDGWSARREPPAGELQALWRAYSHSDTLGLELWGTFAADRLVGFSMTEVLADGWAMVHFEKCDRSVKGAGYAHRRSVARALRDRGCRRLNYEQDLGVPGLRQAKTANRPIDMLRKSTVCRADGG